MSRVGKPTNFSKKKAATICSRLSAGETLTGICKDMEIHRQTVYSWLKRNPDFNSAYNQARYEQGDTLADEIVELADRGREDGVDPKILRLQIDARKWTAAKLRPQRYGDRIVQQHEGGERPISMIQLTADMAEDEAARLYKEMLSGTLAS